MGNESTLNSGVSYLPEDVAPIDAVKEWMAASNAALTEACEGMSVSAGYPSFLDSCMESAKRMDQVVATMTPQEQVIYAFGMGSIHSSAMARTSEPVAFLMAVAMAVQERDVTTATAKLRLTMLYHEVVFLMAASIATGSTAVAFVQSMVQAKDCKTPPPFILQEVPGVH